MKQITIIIILSIIANITLSLNTLAQEQKIVIGSKINEIHNIMWLQNKTWHNEKPLKTNINIIKFFHPSDTSSISKLTRLNQQKQLLGDNIAIIALSKVRTPNIDSLALKLTNIIFGVDISGYTFKKFDVKYIPETFILNQESQIVWIGEYDTFDYNILEQLK